MPLVGGCRYRVCMGFDLFCGTSPHRCATGSDDGKAAAAETESDGRGGSETVSETGSGGGSGEGGGTERGSSLPDVSIWHRALPGGASGDHTHLARVAQAAGVELPLTNDHVEDILAEVADALGGMSILWCVS